MTDNTPFINPSEDITNVFSQDALDEANKDFFEIFMSMFTEARRIAIDECGKNVNYQINRGAWQQGKWAVLLKYRGSRRIILTILRYANLVIPIIIGYGLADASKKYWLIIASVIVLAITFITEERLEANR